MKNTIGTSVRLTLAGESHGEMIVAVLDGMAPGIPVDESFIAAQLSRRRPRGPADTARREPDEYRIVSGCFEGCTTGAPLTILIPNVNVRSADYSPTHTLARPSHADYTAHVKYDGYEDWRGGGHFSGRVTVGIVAAGAIALSALRRKGIVIGTHILECAGVKDTPFSGSDPEIAAEEAARVAAMDFPVLADVRAAMEEAILAAKADGDSAGGIIQTAVCGLPAGVGEPWFSSLDGEIASALFSIGGIKGVEFGSGFALAGMRGSQANDTFYIRDGKILTRSNCNGGVNGGISNGMPLIINAVVKPTPSIAKAQETIDMSSNSPAVLELKGRHDPAIVRRVCVVASSLLAIVICDQLALRFGTNYLR